MIENIEQFQRRDVAAKIALEIMQHPSYPFGGEDFPRAMVTIIDRGLQAWHETQKK